MFIFSFSAEISDLPLLPILACPTIICLQGNATFGHAWKKWATSHNFTPNRQEDAAAVRTNVGALDGNKSWPIQLGCLEQPPEIVGCDIPPTGAYRGFFANPDGVGGYFLPAVCFIFVCLFFGGWCEIRWGLCRRCFIDGPLIVQQEVKDSVNIEFAPRRDTVDLIVTGNCVLVWIAETPHQLSGCELFACLYGCFMCCVVLFYDFLKLTKSGIWILFSRRGTK